MSQLDVCVAGEINCDLILYGLPQVLEVEKELLANRMNLTLGSSSAIFAHNLSVLGAKTGMISKIGKDVFGRMALERLREGGVDISRVSQSSSGVPTGLTVILARDGQRYILTCPGTMFEFSYEDIDFDYLLSARHFHLSSFFLHRALRPKIVDLFRLAKQSGMTTSLDTNDDPEGKWARDLLGVLPFVDVFLPNEREAKAATGVNDLSKAIDTLTGISRVVVVKLGDRGAVAREGSKEWHCPSLEVDAVDPVGAGDSFDAGFIHRFLAGARYDECLAYANAVAAFSTTCEGGTEAFRDRKNLAQFLRDCHQA